MSVAIVEGTEGITFEGLMELIERLPREDQLRLAQTINSRSPNRKEPPAKVRRAQQPMPDRSREWQWIETHKVEYGGQWVALDGDRLIAASPVQQNVWQAVKASGIPLPFVHRITAPDELPFVNV